MNWIQVLTIIGANVGLSITLFLWLRKEANADRKEISSSIGNAVNRFTTESTAFREMWYRENAAFHEKWAEESKQFHGRLLLLEHDIKAWSVKA